VSDADSINEYGTKELLYSASNLDAASALTLANTLLNAKRNPPAQIELGDTRLSQLYGPWYNRLEKSVCPAGVWMRIKDISGYVPPKFVDASLIFVEEANYDATTDRYTPRPREGRNPFEVTQVRNS
jgi:hypothetical protein